MKNDIFLANENVSHFKSCFGVSGCTNDPENKLTFRDGNLVPRLQALTSTYFSSFMAY